MSRAAGTVRQGFGLCFAIVLNSLYPQVPGTWLADQVTPYKLQVIFKMSLKMLVAPAIIMGLNYAGIDYTNPNTILSARILYGVGQLAVLLLSLFIFLRIKKNNDSTTFKIKKPVGMLEAAKQAQAPKSEGEDDLEEVTVVDYDTAELWKLVKGNLIGMAITLFIHIKWGFVPPLVIQVAMSPVTLWSNPLVQLYLIGKPATGSLARPFKAEAPDLFGLQKKMEEMKAEQMRQADKEKETRTMREEAKQRLEQEKQSSDETQEKKRSGKRKH